MGFFDDVKEDQTLQIQVLCVAFFLIAFPSYFMIKASATENPTGMGGVGSYTVTADFSYIDFASGDCLLYTSPSPRDVEESRMPSSA